MFCGMNGIAIARNLKNSLDTAEEKGETKGEAKERVIGTGSTDSRQITNQRTCPYDSGS